MIRRLTAETLAGVWAAVPTPWTSTGEVDVAALAENVRRYADAGVPAVYTTDADGEFYALELAEFRRLVSAFAKSVEETGMDAAAGVTWCNTRGVVDRILASLDAGIPNVHVAFPFFMPLAQSDVTRFFDDLARAAPEARWIHYRSIRAHILPSGREYADYHRRFPEQLIGTKITTSEISGLTEIISGAPQLAHFASEYCFVAAALAGAKGIYSFWVNTVPEWMLESWQLCRQGRWQEAMQRQAKLIQWETSVTGPLIAAGHNHAVLGKARAALSGFLLDNGITQAPYYPVEPAAMAAMKRQFESFWADEIARHRAARSARSTQP